MLSLFIKYMITDFIWSKIFPVRTTQFLMDWAHDYMPFWLIVVSIPWITKAVIILPSIIWQHRKYETICHRIPQAMEDYAYLHNEKSAATKMGAAVYGEMHKSYNQRQKELKSKYGFNPYTQEMKKMIPAMMQIPVHMSLYVATRTMYPTYPDWKQGGILWFQDLSIGDPYYVWPTISALTMIVSGWALTKNMNLQAQFPNVPMNLILYLTTAASLCVIPISRYFPVGLNIYVASNIISYMTQTWLLDNQQFRDLVGLKPKSYAANIQQEIIKKNKELKGIVGSGTRTKFDSDIKGKRGATGKQGRKVKLKTVRK